MTDDYYKEILESTWQSNDNSDIYAYVTAINKETDILTVDIDTENGEVVREMPLSELLAGYENISGDDVQW